MGLSAPFFPSGSATQFCTVKACQTYSRHPCSAGLDWKQARRGSGPVPGLKIVEREARPQTVHAHDYVKQEKYTFPVIADWVLANKLFPADTCRQGCSYGLSCPSGGKALASRQWVVNPKGRLSYPFHAWSFGRLLFALEDVATN